MGGTISHRREQDSQFNAWSGIGSSWSYGSFGGGKTTGYYGRSSSGSAVGVFKFVMPSSLPTGSALTKITLFVNGCPSVSSGTTTIARLALSNPSSDTPTGWLNRGDYISESTVDTNGTVGTDAWHSYTFTSFSSGVKAGTTLYFYLYGTSSSSLVDYNITAWSPYLDISYETPVTPTSVTRNVSYSGFSGSDQSFTATSNTAGYYLVTTGTPSSSTAKWYKRPTSTSNATSCTFVVDKDTTTTSLYKTYRLTVIPNCNGTYTGATSNYKTFYAPRFAFKGYVNSSSPTEINSYSYSTLTSPKTISGYTFQGWASSSTSTSVINSSGASWATSLNNVTRYAVYKKPASTTTVTLNANGGSISSTSASKTVSAAYIYGKASTSGGTASYTNGALTPTRPGYEFLGWTVDGDSAFFPTPKAALDAGYNNVTLSASWKQDKGARIFDTASSSSLYAAYIHDGSSWGYYIPYVHNGSTWQEMG